MTGPNSPILFSSSTTTADVAKARGVKPILGCEVYVAPGSRLTKSGNIGETANHLVLLAETNEGYHNLIKLVSAGYTEGFYYKPRIDKQLLAQIGESLGAGLTGLVGCSPSGPEARRAGFRRKVQPCGCGRRRAGVEVS